MLGRLLLVSVVLPVFAGQLSGSRILPAAVRPVEDVTARPDIAQIEFVGFDFEEPALYEVSVHYGPIEGEPSIGVEYGVEASIGGDEAIATAVFDAIDEDGSPIQRIAMVRQANGVAGGSDFVGLMRVPDRPFRIRLSGESIDGRAFNRTFRRRFRPVEELPDTRPYPDLPREVAAEFERLLNERAPAVIAERKALLAGSQAGIIVMPRTQVFDVAYAPFLSGSGRPIGIEVTYAIKFSQAGRYVPELRIAAELEAGVSYDDNNRLHALKASVEPLPHEVYAPEKAAEISARAFQPFDLLYSAGTVYRFTLDLVPEYIGLEKATMMPCIERELLDRYPAKAIARLVSGDALRTYRVFISGKAFEGRIVDFHGEGMFYQSLVADGVRDCARVPASGF